MRIATLKTVKNSSKEDKTAVTVAEMKKNVSFKWTVDHDQAFPDVDPGLKICGSRVLVQIRSPRLKSKGGIILQHETKETELWNTQVGLVRQIGSLAFRNRETLAPWPEGDWCNPGEFVRVPKYGGDRFEVELGSGEKAVFMIVNDTTIFGCVTVDPLNVKAFV